MKGRATIGFVLCAAMWAVLFGMDQGAASEHVVELPSVGQDASPFGGANTTAQSNPFQATQQQSTGLFDTIVTKIELSLGSLILNNLVPNFPGLFLLLVLSMFFSSINFFWEHESGFQSLRHTYGYFALWVMSNYFFALIILLLILPEDETLDTIDRGMFLYCLLATALPEISSNLRLQLGQSSRMLDLYKYKKRVSDMISERLEKSSREVKDRELELLTYYFTGRLEQFENKLVLFSQRDFTKEEKTDLTALIKEVHNGVEQEKGEEKGVTVAHLLVNHSLILPKLLEFFQNDIRTIQGSPVVQLLSGLQPLLSLKESRALVQSGITTPGAFVRRCWFSFRRTSLAQKTGLDQERIELIYRTTRGIIRGRRRSRAKWAFAVVVLILVITNLGALYGDRLRIIVPQTAADNARDVDPEELPFKFKQ